MKKPATKAEREYMAYVKTHRCIINNAECSGATEAHHVGVGMGQSKNHQKLLPLCNAHHKRFGINGIAFHSTGRKVWEAKYGSEQELHHRFVSRTGDYEAFTRIVRLEREGEDG